MTIEQILDKLGEERSFSSRYAARAIFVENLEDYTSLVGRLSNACDVTKNLADFLKKEDGLPKFDKLREFISEHAGEQILLLSVGEYLRMCIKRETDKQAARFPDFWQLQQSVDSKTRVIMPIFCARDCFDRVISNDERTEHFAWSLDSKADKNYTITVYSPQFADAVDADAHNFGEWLSNWASILTHESSCTVVSQQLKNAEDTFGTITMKTINSPFNYLIELLGEPSIDPSWEDDDFWTALIPSAKACGSFDALVKNKLSMSSFEFISILAQWNILSDEQKELIWMWYRIHPTGEYYSYACKKADRASEIPERIRDEILLLESRTDVWIEERMKAMSALNFMEFDAYYFKLLDKLRLPKMKLQLLTFKTHEERTYAIRVISDMLRDGIDLEAIADMIKKVYPALATYLTGKSGLDAEVDEYLAWYRENKLINRFPGNYPKTILFERFDSRYKQIQKMAGKDCFNFWIDGFGMEWLPVFLYELKKRGITPEAKYLTTSLLPTETDYNHQWDENDPTEEKWIRLDKLSHNGQIDDGSYFSCIDLQLGVFAEAAKAVEEHLQDHEYVLITGDHGSSRMAALGFHETSIPPVTPPPHSVVKCLGRFIELPGDGSSYTPLSGMKKIQHSNGKYYVVMCDYRHFQKSGNAAGGNDDEHDVAGEVHGGNTPEERLVPVIIVKRKMPLPPLTCKPYPNENVIKKMGHFETTFEFNRDVYSLEVSIGKLEGTCEKRADGRWKIAFDVTSGEAFSVSVVANGALLPEEVKLKVKTSGMTKTEGMGKLP